MPTDHKKNQPGHLMDDAKDIQRALTQLVEIVAKSIARELVARSSVTNQTQEEKPSTRL